MYANFACQESECYYQKGSDAFIYASATGGRTHVHVDEGESVCLMW